MIQFLNRIFGADQQMNVIAVVAATLLGPIILAAILWF